MESRDTQTNPFLTLLSAPRNGDSFEWAYYNGAPYERYIVQPLIDSRIYVFNTKTKRGGVHTLTDYKNHFNDITRIRNINLV